MNLMKLKYFYTTAKLENISLAAEELLISQPALSKAIANLEADLQMDLFYRNGKRIVLNENGKLLYHRAKRILNEIDEIRKELDERNGIENGTLSIVTTLPHTLVEILELFLEKYPKTTIKQAQLSRENLEAFTLEGKYDICITTVPVTGDSIEWIPLYEEEIFLSVPIHHTLAQQNSVNLLALNDVSFIGLNQDFSFRKLTDTYCEQMHFCPYYQYEVEEPTIILQLVKNGRGISFSPKSSINLYPNQIKHLRIENSPFQRTIGLAIHRYQYRSNLTNEFINHCKEYYDVVD